MRKLILLTLVIFFCGVNTGHCFWMWSPKTQQFTNPKWSVKGTSKEQLEFAKSILDSEDYKNALVEFRRLLRYYPESLEAPEAQFYIGECLDKLEDTYNAYLAYQKVIDKYAFTDKIDAVLEREFKIAEKLSDAKIKFLGMDVPQYYHAIRIYKKIIENSPYGKLASLSQYRIAIILKNAGDFTEARKEFNKVISTYPDSEWAEAAKFQVAKTASLSSLQPDYDQEASNEARAKYEEFVKTHPQAELSQEAEKEIDTLTDRQAEKDFKVAEFYEKQKAYKSAKIYYEGIISGYPGSPWAKNAKEKISELMKEGKL
ncbi:MAG: outer membrane protein assembly factor BamD [Candidatus Omnitrophica bacterium]|nr:outer membrane protein assembly factor BamD [Candidatus Omnitrophota bacterium]MDD5355828.1 outer membrane protein assembly factor BamD [Candidatus Omnitrophota bacterium]